MKEIIRENDKFRVIRKTKEFDNENVIPDETYSKYIVQKRICFNIWITIAESLYNNVTNIKYKSKEPNYRNSINIYNAISNMI